VEAAADAVTEEGDGEEADDEEDWPPQVRDTSGGSSAPDRVAISAHRISDGTELWTTTSNFHAFPWIVGPLVVLRGDGPGAPDRVLSTGTGEAVYTPDGGITDVIELGGGARLLEVGSFDTTDGFRQLSPDDVHAQVTAVSAQGELLWQTAVAVDLDGFYPHLRTDADRLLLQASVQETLTIDDATGAVTGWRWTTDSSEDRWRWAGSDADVQVYWEATDSGHGTLPLRNPDGSDRATVRGGWVVSVDPIIVTTGDAVMGVRLVPDG
jgi:hypothetical protein